MRAAPFLLAALLAPAATAQESHPFGVGDLLAMERVSDPQASPDGAWVAFTLRTTDLEANKGRTDVWIAAVDGSSVRRMTTDPANDWNARWSADGSSLFFLSTRGGSAQVWELPLEGGEARQRTRLPLDVENLAVFPTGERLVLTLDVYPDAATLEETAKRDEERTKGGVQARVYDSLPVRHWDAWEDGKRSHVFVWSLATPDAPPVDLMKGIDADSPTKPFGGGEEIAIAPDGSEVVFAYKAAGREAVWTTNVDLWSAPADGSRPPRNLTAANPALDNLPAFSPDGRWLAHVAMTRPGYESDRQRIVLIERASGARRVLTEGWDRSASEVVFSSDGRTIWTSADHLGHHALFGVSVEDGQVGTIAAEGHNTSPCPAGKWLVWLRDDLRSPAELVATMHGGVPATPVTRINAARVAAARTGEPEPFTFTGAHGDEVHGWLVRPAGFDQAKRYPLAFLIHGGPQGSFGNHFHYRWNPQVYAGAGYAAVMIDFHGSTGYGQAFTDSINRDWGGAPYEDLMKGLDHVLERHPFLDGSRVAALGASYGGYMINWIAGHTERFRCLVNHDGVFDDRSMYFETEELWFPEWEHGGPPWQHPERYAAFDPQAHVEAWKTPMLVVHGARDFRVPESQGLAAFTALQRRGVPSKLLHFPDENHWVLKPKNSVLWHETVLGWLEQWTRAEAAADEPRAGGR
jgi:dipeptidyl aminopeptidase/acylaminoacyl peptidase